MNKVSSKIELQFDLLNSEAINEEERLRLQKKLAYKLTNSGLLIIQCEDTRSQHRNKEIAIKRLQELIKKALVKKKKRKPTKVPKAVKKKRLDAKSRHSEKKQSRKKPDIDS